jgi:hypothetical protein
MTLPLILLQEQSGVVFSLECAYVACCLAKDEHGKHKDLRGLGRRRVIPYVHERDGCCIVVCLLKSRLSSLQVGLPILTPAQPFIAQSLNYYIETRDRHVTLG